MIYLDNAATSFPKAPGVVDATVHFMTEVGANAGRGSHRLAREASHRLFDVRERCAAFLGIQQPERLAFTKHATEALNLVLMGQVPVGGTVVLSSLEHNAVMRPLRELEKRGVIVDVVPAREDGAFNLEDFADALRQDARLVVLNHASNVTGTLTNAAEIARLAHKAGALMLLDAAQTAGVVEIDMPSMGIDLLAFTGHKGLQGPPGTGGLVIGDWVDPREINPLVFGGTGSKSEHEIQPEDLPDRYESGTPNGVGIAGLGAGLKWVAERGLKALRMHDIEIMDHLLVGLANIKGVRLFGPQEPRLTTAVTSFVLEGSSVSEVGYRLDEEYGILCRVGLHCAPAAHRSIGSFPHGTVRLAPGPLTTLAEIETVVGAVERIEKG